MRNWLSYIISLEAGLVRSLDFKRAGVDMCLVMGFKELYGGGLFLRESNNTLIFVRSNYRVCFILRKGDLIYSWAHLDGWLGRSLRKRGVSLTLDFMIRKYIDLA